MMKSIAILLAASVILRLPHALAYDLVTVGDAGNSPGIYSYGAVDWDYQIGKYEVTIQQYADFLNAVAPSDPYCLYNTKMASDLNSAGIQRSGVPGSYTYSVIDNFGDSANRPITYVSWFDAARFANWMSNGQPVGAADSTEDGAYELLNGIVSGEAPVKRVINPNTGLPPSFYIPSENEWYKAAFYSPALGGGPDSYWQYATQSNAPPGNIIGPAENQINFIVQPSGFYSVTQDPLLSLAQNYLTGVGSFPGSESHYGTYDQNGNVWEITDSAYGPLRSLIVVRGGGWTSYENYLWSSYRLSISSSSESSNGGFRLASPALTSVVPEPSTWALLILALAIILRRHGKILALAILCILSLPHTATAIDYQLVTVGDPGNLHNPASGFGSVPSTYGIGKYDVTIGQYTAFLNAVAASDPHSLYNPAMATALNIAGIQRSGTDGSYTYSVIDNFGSSADRPVTYVSWFDAARFANWMSNGQPIGETNPFASTENGAYPLNEATSGTAPRANTINPNTGAAPAFILPTLDQWYKAAYYSPDYAGPGDPGYYTYATQSNDPPRNSSFTGENRANLYLGAFTTTQSNIYSDSQNYLTDVGAFVDSESHYGTYDQNGNVYQWNDLDGAANTLRGVAGGFWFGGPNSATATTLASQTPSYEGNDTGFRLATPIPESRALVIIALALPSLLLLRRLSA